MKWGSDAGVWKCFRSLTNSTINFEENHDMWDQFTEFSYMTKHGELRAVHIIYLPFHFFMLECEHVLNH